MNKKIMIKMFIIFIVLIAFILILTYFIDKEKLKNVPKIEASYIKLMPSYNENVHTNQGFTCTGLYYDETQNLFYIGNIGKYKLDEKTFKSTIEIVDSNFENIVKTIKLYDKYPNLKDIQGITKNNENNIWFCSPAENMVRLISEEGTELFKISVKNPTGIAYDTTNESLWVLTNSFLINYSEKGKLIKKFFIKEPGQDQLFIDGDRILFTAGIDYNGDSYVYEVNLKTGKYKIKYILKDSFAIEGISFLDEDMIILNDGYYHDAKIPKNQINIYKNIRNL